jgi:hypothetical protein
MRTYKGLFAGHSRDSVLVLITRMGWFALLLISVIYVVLFFALLINHIESPELTRGSFYESVLRFREGKPLYPEPSEEFVPLAYNPLITVLGALFLSITGPSSAALRLTSSVAAVGLGILIFLIAYKETATIKFGVITAGLYSSAYLTFDSYLDYGNPDSWMLFTGVLGLSLLQYNPKKIPKTIAIMVLCGSFWFKQHGAFFVLAGLLYLTYIYGLRYSIKYWAVGLIFGPLAFFTIGPRLFGEYLLYYTVNIPRTWVEINFSAFDRYLAFMSTKWSFFLVLNILGLSLLFSKKFRINIWIFSFPVILSMGLIGSFDAGGENNVYIAPGIWFIVVGIIVLNDLLNEKSSILQQIGLSVFQSNHYLKFANFFSIGLILGAFSLNFYRPQRVFIPSKAWSEYNELIYLVNSLDGIVYLPDVGQLQDKYHLPVPIHWVALDDLVRGSDDTEENDQLIHTVLHDLFEPDGNAYILAFAPLENYGVFYDLQEKYILIEDFGDRFRSLKALPGRFSGHSWPRYLYAHVNNQSNR